MAAAETLSALSFEVTEAEHAHGALRHLEANDKVALLYTDANMPGAMDGCDLAHAVYVGWPDTRIIVCSGCMPDEAPLLPDAAHFISKPCAEELVLKALQALQLHWAFKRKAPRPRHRRCRAADQ